MLVHFAEDYESKAIAGMLGKSRNTIYDNLHHLRSLSIVVSTMK